MNFSSVWLLMLPLNLLAYYIQKEWINLALLTVLDLLKNIIGDHSVVWYNLYIANKKTWMHYHILSKGGGGFSVWRSGCTPSALILNRRCVHPSNNGALTYGLTGIKCCTVTALTQKHTKLRKNISCCYSKQLKTLKGCCMLNLRKYIYR